MLISEQYRKLNERLHVENLDFGVSAKKYVAAVQTVCKRINTQSVLDYGCGKRLLSQLIGFPIAEYDPAVLSCSGNPSPTDVVVCIEVLEHIEPLMLDEVLAHIAKLTQRIVFFTVGMGPAHKTLADGRNAHLIQQPLEWWRSKIERHFRMCRIFGTDSGFAYIGQSLNDTLDSPDFCDIGPPPESKEIRCKSVYNDDQRCTNIRSAMLRGLPAISVLPAHDKTMVLACYGPSLADLVTKLQKDVAAGGDLFTTSGAHQFLLERDIVPMAHVETDPRPINVHRMGKPDLRVAYFLASACDRALFDLLHSYETFLYHVTSSVKESDLIRQMGGTFTVDGGTNVGMSAISLGTVLGYRRFSIYGMDCSYKVDANLLNAPKDEPFTPEMLTQVRKHSGPHPNEDKDIYRVWVGKKPFVTSPQLLQGAQDFIAMCGSPTAKQCTFKIHGDGFLRELIAHIEERKQTDAASLRRIRSQTADRSDCPDALDYASSFKAGLYNSAGAQPTANHSTRPD